MNECFLTDVRDSSISCLVKNVKYDKMCKRVRNLVGHVGHCMNMDKVSVRHRAESPEARMTVTRATFLRIAEGPHCDVDSFDSDSCDVFQCVEHITHVDVTAMFGHGWDVFWRKALRLHVADVPSMGDRAHSYVPNVVPDFVKISCTHPPVYAVVREMDNRIRIGLPSRTMIHGGIVDNLSVYVPECLEMPGLVCILKHLNGDVPLSVTCADRSAQALFRVLHSAAERFHVAFRQLSDGNVGWKYIKVRDCVSMWCTMVSQKKYIASSRRGLLTKAQARSGAVYRRPGTVADTVHPYNSIHANTCWLEGHEKATFICKYENVTVPSWISVLRHFKYTDSRSHALKSTWRWNKNALFFCVGLYALRSCTSADTQPQSFSWTVLQVVETVAMEERYVLSAAINALVYMTSYEWFEHFCTHVCNVGKFLLNVGDELLASMCAPYEDSTYSFATQATTTTMQLSDALCSPLVDHLQVHVSVNSNWVSDALIRFIVGDAVFQHVHRTVFKTVNSIYESICAPAQTHNTVHVAGNAVSDDHGATSCDAFTKPKVKRKRQRKASAKVHTDFNVTAQCLKLSTLENGSFSHKVVTCMQTFCSGFRKYCIDGAECGWHRRSWVVSVCTGCQHDKKITVEQMAVVLDQVTHVAKEYSDHSILSHRECTPSCFGPVLKTAYCLCPFTQAVVFYSLEDYILNRLRACLRHENQTGDVYRMCEHILRENLEIAFEPPQRQVYGKASRNTTHFNLDLRCVLMSQADWMTTAKGAAVVEKKSAQVNALLHALRKTSSVYKGKSNSNSRSQSLRVCVASQQVSN